MKGVRSASGRRSVLNATIARPVAVLCTYEWLGKLTLNVRSQDQGRIKEGSRGSDGARSNAPGKFVCGQGRPCKTDCPHGLSCRFHGPQAARRQAGS